MFLLGRPNKDNGSEATGDDMFCVVKGRPDLFGIKGTPRFDSKSVTISVITCDDMIIQINWF